MKQLKIKSLFFPVILLLSLSSCLKKDPMNIDTSKGPKNVVEFANSGDNLSGSLSTYPGFHMDLPALDSGESSTFIVNVSYSGVDVAPQDITVNLSIDQATLTTYNTQNGTSYVIPPSAIFTFPNSAIIKKGTRLVQVPVTITNNISYDFNASYALPLQIASASMGVISGNFGKAVYSFGLISPYSGVFSGYHVHIIKLGALLDDFDDPAMTLYTINANTVYQKSIGDYFGGYSQYQLNPDGTISVQAGGSSADPNGYGAVVLASHYDAATTSFYVKFTILGGKYVFEETFNR
ncbi:MAG TPA: DUF1735 domain-containing protein [Hanamia sp.]